MDLDGIHKRDNNSKDGEHNKDVDEFVNNERKTVNDMVGREYYHLKVASEIDKQIIAIQRSSRVSIPQLSFLHNYLRMKYGWYYRWHLNKWANIVHLGLLVVAILYFLYIVYYLVIPHSAFASTHNCYWVGDADSSAWNDASHWSSSSGGSGSTCNGGANIPGLETVVIFDASSTYTSVIDDDFAVDSVVVNSGYSGTITQNADLTTTGNISISGGTWNVGVYDLITTTADLIVGSTLNIGGSLSNGIQTNDLTINSSKSLIASGDAIITLSGNWSNSGTFTADSSTVVFNASSGVQTLDSGEDSFANITKSVGGSLQVANSDISIGDTLTISASTTFDINGYDLTLATLSNSGTLRLVGDETVTITSMDSTHGTVEYYGNKSYSSLVAGDAYNNLKINADNNDMLQAVSVSNSSGGTLSNHQVKIVLNAINFKFSDSTDDGRDIRIKYNDGTTDLPFFIESWDQSAKAAVIWTKVTSIPTTGQTIYISYGDDELSSASSGDDTFDFFDDFEGSSIDTSNWDTNSTATISTDYAYTGSKSAYINSMPALKSSYDVQGKIMEYSFYHETTGTTWSGLVKDGFVQGILSSSSTYYAHISGSYYNTSIPVVNGVWHTGAFKDDGTNIKSYINDTYTGSQIASGSSGIQFYFLNHYIDYIKVRKYASTEPVATTYRGYWTLDNDVTVNGTLNINSGILDADDETVNLTGSGTVFTNNDIFLEKTSTVIYTGSSATDVTASAYYNLTINSSGTTFTSTGNIEVKNVFTITAGVFNASDDTLTLSDHGTPFVNSGTFTPSTSTVIYNGEGDTNIISTAYNNLHTKPTSSGTGGGWIVSGAGDSSYNGTYASSGTHNSQPTYTNGSKWLYYNYDGMGDNYYWVLYSSVTDLMDGSMSAAYYNGTTLPGTWNENWMAMNGPAPTLTESTSYYTYTFASGTINIAGDYVNGDGTNGVITDTDTNDPVLNISGSFTNSAIASFLASDSSSLSVATNFSNHSNAVFTHSGGTVIFNGNGAQSITSSGDAFNNVTVSNTSAEVSQSDAITIVDTLTISSGATYDINGQNIILDTLSNLGKFRLQGGETTVSISTKDTDSGIVEYDGSGTYTALKYGNTYWNLIINGSGSFSQGGDVTVSASMELNDGSFSTSASNHSLTLGSSSTTDGSYSQTGGTFVANSSALTCYGNYSITGGVYTAGSSTLTLDSTPGNIILNSHNYSLNNVNFKSNSSELARKIYLGTDNSQTLSFSGNFYIDAASTKNVDIDATSYNPTVNISGNLDNTGTGSGSEILRTGNGTWTVSGNCDVQNGTFYSGTSKFVLNGNGSNWAAYGHEFYNVDIAANITLTNNPYVGNNATIFSDKTLTISSGKRLEMKAPATLTVEGEITGTGEIWMNPSTTIGEGGVIGTKVYYLVTYGDTTISPRTYGGDVHIHNGGSAARTATLGSASSQTITIQSNLIVSANGSQNVTIAGNTYNPNINVSGNIDFTGTGSGTEIINSGSGAWSVQGSVDFTAGNFNHNSGTFVLSGSGAQSVTSASQSFNNLTTTNASGAGVTFVDAIAVDNMLTATTANAKMTFTAGTTSTINDINLNGQSTSTRIVIQSTTTSVANWNVIATTQTAVSNVSVSYNDASSGSEILAYDGTNYNGGNNINWDFTGNSDPTVDSLEFINPYGGTGNIVVSDNTTEWIFRAKVSDEDGYDDIDSILLRLANSSDSSAPFEATVIKWDLTTDAFSEQTDTQNAVTIVSDSGDSGYIGDQWTLDFKIKINSNFTTLDTNYSAELVVVDSASAFDNDSFSNIYQVKELSLTLGVDYSTLDFSNLLPGSIVTKTTVTTVTCNHPNGYSLAISDLISGSYSSLLHTDSSTRIADYGSSISSPTTWSGTGLGVTVYEATDKDTDKWGSGTSENDLNNKYAGIPENATIIHEKTGSPTASNQTKIGYKVEVPNSQKTGSYSGTVTYTATGVLD